jgi:hypothetical protein
MVNPMLAVVISFFLPGIGSVYAGKTIRGIMIFIVAVLLFVSVYFLGAVAYILYIIVWIYGMYDAYTTSKTLV